MPRRRSPNGDEACFEKYKDISSSSESSLTSTTEAASETLEPHRTLHYFPSEDHLSFYIKLEREGSKKKFEVAPMSNYQTPEGSGENGARNSMALSEEQIASPASLPPVFASTHDTRRAKYHMNELGTFADRLDESASRAFPNRGRARYKQVIAVLIQWGDDASSVQPEIDRMRTIFESCYGFYTQLWLIPSSSSHLKLMSLVLHFLEDYGSSDNLMVVYYGGHGVISGAGQTTWLSKQESLSPSLNWTAIQSLFEETESDVLFLLDCCAIAGPAAGGGQGITETIAASGLEPWPPGPGRNLFTNALISVLEDWITRPSFTAAMLHSEVLSAIKHEKPERRKWADLQKIQDRKTPIYILNSSVVSSLSIELATRRTVHGRSSANFSRPALAPSPLNPSPVFTKYDIYNPANLLKTSKTGELQIPHVLISVALEEDQMVDIEAWYRWVRQIPALAKYAVVEGIYRSYSTLLLMSIPLLIWDVLPDDLAVSFVAYVQSRNLLSAESVEDFHRLTLHKDPEPQRRQLHSYAKSTNTVVAEKHVNELMKTVQAKTSNPAIESATLVKITNIADLPQSPKSPITPKSPLFNRHSLNIDSPTSQYSPVSQTGVFTTIRSSMERPSTARGPDTNRQSTRLDTPRISVEVTTEQHVEESPVPSRPQTANSRPQTAKGSEAGRKFASLDSPLHSRLSVIAPWAEDTNVPPITDGAYRRDSPLHSNPFPGAPVVERPIRAALQTTNLGLNRQSTGAESPLNTDPFALERYINDSNPSRSGLAISTDPVSPTSRDVPLTIDNNTDPVSRVPLDRASSRRAAKLDAALADIFATETKPNSPANNAEKRRSMVVDLEADISETEALIKDLQQEAKHARDEARRAWDELGKREREERERLARLRDGKTIEFGRFILRVVGEGGGRDESVGGKAGRILGTILSPREAMEKRRRAKSEPRYGSNSKKEKGVGGFGGGMGVALVDPRVKITYPPMPPPKNSAKDTAMPKTPVHEFITQQPKSQGKNSKAKDTPVEVYQPTLPAPLPPQILPTRVPSSKTPERSTRSNDAPRKASVSQPGPVEKKPLISQSKPERKPSVQKGQPSTESRPSIQQGRPSTNERRPSFQHQIPERKSSLQNVAHPNNASNNGSFTKPVFGEGSEFPDADPNVMRHMMSFDGDNPSRQHMRRPSLDPTPSPETHRKDKDKNRVIQKAVGKKSSKNSSGSSRVSDVGGKRGKRDKGKGKERETRGRTETAYTFFNDEDLLDKEMAWRSAVVTEELPKRKGSKLVKKRWLSRDRSTGREALDKNGGGVKGKTSDNGILAREPGGRKMSLDVVGSGRPSIDLQGTNGGRRPSLDVVGLNGSAGRTRKGSFDVAREHIIGGLGWNRTKVKV